MFNPITRDYQRIGEPTFQILKDNNSDEISLKIYGYKCNATKLLLYHSLSILLIGIPYVVFNLYPKYGIVKYKPCSLRSAGIVLVGSGHGNYMIVKVNEQKVLLPRIGPTQLRYFIFRHTKYALDPNDGEFHSLEDFIQPDALDDMAEAFYGLSDAERENLFKLYGPNKIDIEIKSYWRLFVEEVFNPFYIFQAFSIVLWCFDDYMSYALCVLALTLFSAITSLLQTRKQSEAVHDLVVSSSCHSIQIVRRGFFMAEEICEVDAAKLVPGDLLVLPATGIIMPCDAVLLSGHCIVNESMLTGESVPVTKTPPQPSPELYSPTIHKRHTLFCGTEVIQTRYYGGKFVLARVVRTGFTTSKGSLVKSILFPSPVGLQFYKDSLKFVFVLFVIAAFGMSFCLYMYIMRNADLKSIIIRTLDIITIVVPPALPAAMTVGVVYSQNRLSKHKIFCISPPRINVCGKVKLACFDKTGTLTEDGLTMHSVISSESAHFGEALTTINKLSVKSPLVQAMATCHSLTRIGGALTGDPLDLIMFENTKWELEEPEVPESAMYDLLAPTVVKPKQCASSCGSGDTESLPYEIGIIRQFPFSSNQQCMTVICRALDTDHMVAFTKGAPERIHAMCQSDTVPKNFAECLASYSSQGFRVIAFGYKELPKKFRWKEAQKVKREVIEQDMTFIGLLVMQNALKEESAPVIKILHNANIRTVMITGDNLYTAISVARNCDMISPHAKVLVIKVENDDNSQLPKIFVDNVDTLVDDREVALNLFDNNCHFALDGRTWTKLRIFYPDLIPHLIVRTTVFARFQPDQKTQLVTSLQKLDYVVSMVGDGANDCGALKAAHVGVSLSQAEASVAAPFTSAIPNISCVLHLLLEGRCTLVTSFAMFKYMALYSLIQFISILILYHCHSILGDFQFLFIDLIVTTSLAVTIGRQGPARKLVPKAPLGSLVSKMNVIPLILQVLVCLLIQIGSLIYLYNQEWFVPLPPGKEEIIESWENTVLFLVSSYQYIILATVYSKGKPYRERLITNFWFIVTALGLICFLTWLVVCPPEKLADIFDVIYLTHHDSYEQLSFRYCLLLFPITHFFVSVFIETYISESIWLKWLIQIISRKKHPKNKYKRLLQQTDFMERFNIQCGGSAAL